VLYIYFLILITTLQGVFIFILQMRKTMLREDACGCAIGMDKPGFSSRNFCLKPITTLPLA
jgi:hypothetical protein